MPVVIVAFSFGRLGARPAAASEDGTSPGLGPGEVPSSPRHPEGPVRAPSALLGLPCSPLAHSICPVSTASTPRATGGPARGQKEVKIWLEQPNHVSARRSQL